jgi:16S rRNA A1518/A1519 N6-dimethyltransferase RsmA/KsgA/DIM1 with predicted DNA glycosylase/AP lyase activity
MQNASGGSRYYAAIAERIAAYLPPSARVFDAGGGLGDLAIWLSYHVEHVTVIEQDPKAVAAFRARCPQNVAAMLGDVFSYSPDQLYDALVLCFFGKPDEFLPLSQELTRGKTFVVQSCDTTRGFSLDEDARRSSLFSISKRC